MSTNGLEYLDKLRIGYPELQWLQDEILQRLQDQMSGLVAPQQYGWSMRWTSICEADVGWRVKSSTSGLLQTQLQEAYVDPPYHRGSQRRAPRSRYCAGIDQDGRPLFITAPGGDIEGITVPDDGAWRTLVCRYGTTTKEPGTLTLTAGSTTVTGVGTEFTRLAAATSPRGMLLRIDSADTVSGNEGFYRVATIVDDTNITLATPPLATESDVQFRVQGEFFGGTPAAPDIHNHATVTWELVTRSVTPPTDGLIYGDVMYDSGASANVNVLDRRYAQHVRKRDPSLVGIYLAAPNPDPSWQDQLGGNIESAEYVAAARCRGGAATDAGVAVGTDLGPTSQLIVTARADGSGGHDIVVRERIPYAVTRTAGPDHVGTEDVAFNIADGVNGLCLVALPLSYSRTHLLFNGWDGAGKSLQVHFTTDNGAAGSWSSSATVCNPAGNNTIQNPRGLITRMGRVIVVFEYTDVDGTGDTSIRYVYSDDYGATWENNSGAAFVIREEAGLDHLTPDIAEDDDGTLWTAWKRGNNEIRMVQGQGLNDPTPSGVAAQQPDRGFIVSQQATAAGARTKGCGRPCIVPGPGGVLVLYQELNTTTINTTLYQAWTAGGIVLRVTELPSLGDISDGTIGELYGDMVVHPMAGGFTSIVYADGLGTGYIYADFPTLPMYRSLHTFQGV